MLSVKVPGLSTKSSATASICCSCVISTARSAPRTVLRLSLAASGLTDRRQKVRLEDQQALQPQQESNRVMLVKVDNTCSFNTVSTITVVNVLRDFILNLVAVKLFLHLNRDVSLADLTLQKSAQTAR